MNNTSLGIGIIIGVVAVFIISPMFGMGWGMNRYGNDTHRMPDGSMMSGSMMQHEMSDMMSGLAGKTGDAFDQAFLEEMIIHHEGAVDMAEAALVNAKHQEIKDLSKAIITAQTSEITQMKEWLKNWYSQQ